MKDLEDKSIDMVLADLPYGTTACKWDTVIPMEPLWKEYNRVTKDNAAMVFFGSQPFTANLIVSNLENYRYDWIWDKVKPTGQLNSKRRPMKYFEQISIFYKKTPKYYPQMWQSSPMNSVYKQSVTQSDNYGKTRCIDNKRLNTTERFPKDIIRFTAIPNNSKERAGHPTQKPVALLEYLIKTYTNEGDTVLDNVMGSGSTGVACRNLNRKFIGIEKEEKYFKIAEQRINELPK